MHFLHFQSLIILSIISLRLRSEECFKILKTFIESEEESSHLYERFLVCGEMDGFYSYSQLQQLFSQINEQYPKHFSKGEEIGLSYKKNHILAFTLSNDLVVNQNLPQVLFTSLHHSREPLGLTMLLAILARYLRKVYQRDSQSLIFYNLILVPFVNVDGYIHISEYWNRP